MVFDSYFEIVDGRDRFTYANAPTIEDATRLRYRFSIINETTGLKIKKLFPSNERQFKRVKEISC